MGTIKKAQSDWDKYKGIVIFVAFCFGAYLVIKLLTPFTPAAASLVALVLGFSSALTVTRFDSSEQPVASTQQVRLAEGLFAGLAVLALMSLPSAPTIGHGVGGALVVGGIILGGRHLGRRHQKWQPTSTVFGVIADSWGRLPGRAPAVAMLVGSVVLGGALNMYVHFGPVVGVVLAMVAGRPYWSAARQDAMTRMTVSETLSGSMSGGAWTKMLLDMQRAPIGSLELTDDGIPSEIVVPIPTGMAADAQPAVEKNIIDRLAGWGTYSVKWYTGGPDGKRRAVIKWWPPLPDIVHYDGRPGIGRKVWLGIGKVNREMLITRPDATVGAQEDVYLDFAEIPHALIVGGTGGGKSVVAQTLCIQWVMANNLLVILDPKQVGFTRFIGKKNVLKVATNIFEIRDTIVAGRVEMDSRYAEMKATGLDNIMDLPEGERPRALLFLIDEASEAMAIEKVAKDDAEGNERNQAAMEIRAAVSAIARLGRAAGVHLCLLTQRPDATDIAGQTKANLEGRVLLGAADDTARGMAGFPKSEVSATPGKRGRGIFGRVNTSPVETQFGYATNANIERYLDSLSLADAPVVYGDEGVTVLDAVAAAQYEADRMEVLRAAHAADDLTDEDLKALGFDSITDVENLLATYDTNRAESDAVAAAEVEDEKVEAQLKPKTPAKTVAPTTIGGDTTGNPATPVNQPHNPDLQGTRRHTGKRIEPLTVGEAEAELARMIGLRRAKAEFATIRAQVVMALKRAEHGMGDGNVSPGHLILAGPPGTGKTMFARIVGSILRDLGVLASGHVIEMTPKDVKAPFVGQSGPMADSACDDAIDGVLFIDEGYGLTRDEFTREALEQIMVRAENDRHRLVIILAGYTKEMDDLLDVNPGMRSRFENRIHFAPYDREELVAIAESMIQDSQRILDADGRGALVDLMAGQDLTARDWGNARSVRNLVGAAMKANDNRLTALVAGGADLTKAQMATLTREDILAAGAGDWTTAGEVHAADAYTPTYAEEFGDDEDFGPSTNRSGLPDDVVDCFNHGPMGPPVDDDGNPLAPVAGDTTDTTGGMSYSPPVVTPAAPDVPPVVEGGLDDWFDQFGDDQAV